MKKGIYLNVWLRIEPIAAAHAPITDFSRQAAIIRNVLTSAEVAWAIQSNLHLQVKWIQPVIDTAAAADPNQTPLTSVLSYVEGEQDAPSDFAKLTISLVSDLFHQSSPALAAQGLELDLQRIFEDTAAVDELADDI